MTATVGMTRIEAAKLAGLTRRPSAGRPLTRRQLEVLRAIAAGCTRRQAGRRLYITVRTVSTQMDRVLRKLDVRTAAAAVDRAIQLGLLSETRPGVVTGMSVTGTSVTGTSVTDTGAMS